MTLARPNSVTSLRNLGPAIADMLYEVDIPDVDTLRQVGAVDAFRRLKFRFEGHVSLTALYAMQAGLDDQDWRDLSADDKARLRQRVAPKS